MAKQAEPGSKVPLRNKKPKKKKTRRHRKDKADDDEDDRLGGAIEGTAAMGAMAVGGAGIAGAVAAREGHRDGDDDHDGVGEHGAGQEDGVMEGVFDMGIAD